MHRPARSLLLLPVLLACGCPEPAQPAQPAQSPAPSATQAPPPPRVIPAPSAPPERVVPPRPAPADAAAAWREAVARGQGRATTLARALKTPAEREALLRPFAQPTPELQRLLLLAHALPVFDQEVKRPVPLTRRVRVRLRAQPALDPATLPPEGDAALALLGLSDPALFHDERLLLSAQGWQSVAQGMRDKSLPAARAQALLRGVEQARDGDWTRGAPALLAALRELCAANSRVAAAEAEWRRVDAALAGDSGPLREALAAWSARFTAKPKLSKTGKTAKQPAGEQPPVVKVKKGG
ncbi:MAG: hypothetical protein AB7N76_02035 [Planctomycetota bacterium]